MNENAKDSISDLMLPPNWFWPKMVPKNIIECLNEDIEKMRDKISKGTFGLPGSKLDLDPTIRNSDILMLDPLHWFSGIMFNVAIASNTYSGWNFNITGPSEATQIAFYGFDQHYTWHEDSAMMMKNNYIRKVTTICMLSDPSDFEGGKLEFENIGEITLEQGDIISFPSFSKHRVTPVTSGFRKTATLWVSGNRSW